MQRKTMIGIAVGILVGFVTAGTSIKCGGAEAETPPPVVEYVNVPCQREHLEPHYASIARTITPDELELVAKIVYLEAGNQSLTGQRAVVEVIFNRVLSDKFPNSIKEVIYQKNPVQFSTAAKVGSATPTNAQYQAIEMTLATTEPVLNSDVLFFSTHANWRTTYEQIGAHYFCY